MKFELLPNEIIIDCVEYLNTFDIFYSFDQLNHRLTKLIRSIPLHINFKNIRKRKFDQFCKKLLFNPEMKHQINSLHLSNKDTCGQINVFLSYFSLDIFSHLQSLTLTQMEKENISKLKSMLPLLSNLSSFHLISSQSDEDEIISTLPISNLRRLSILSLRSILPHIHQTTIITHLTIYSCSLEQLFYELFEYIPLLEYLNVEYISKYNRSIKNNTIIDKYNAIHLKRLIIGKFKYPFEDFSIFVKQTPNLKSLSITADNDIGMFDGNQWEYLIKSSLSNLKMFQFKFTCKSRYSGIIMQYYTQFQGDFWVKQHHWYTQLISTTHSIDIYTIPYLLNTFKLECGTKNHRNRLLNHSNTFDKVINLTLSSKQRRNTSSYYFPNVISLTLITPEEETIDPSLQILDIESLKLLINLSNLKHLDISMYQRMILSGELLQILNQSPQLSSLTINPNDFILLFDDDELCTYLNKRIEKLNIYKYSHSSFDNLDQLNKFCSIFSNIEQLKCSISRPKDILFLLHRLSKLSTAYIYLSAFGDRKYLCSLFQKYLRKLNCTIRIKGIGNNAPELSIWMEKKIG